MVNSWYKNWEQSKWFSIVSWDPNERFSQGCIGENFLQISLWQSLLIFLAQSLKILTLNLRIFRQSQNSNILILRILIFYIFHTPSLRILTFNLRIFTYTLRILTYNLRIQTFWSENSDKFSVIVEYCLRFSIS